MEPKKKKQRIYCCVWGCKVTSMNSPGTHFYCFPSMPHRLLRRQAWIDAVRKNNPRQAKWEPNNFSRICSHHFVGNKRRQNPLSSAYIPTIFPDVCDKPMKPMKPMKAVRGKRCKKKDSPTKEEHSPKRRKTQPDRTATENQETQVNFPEKLVYHSIHSFSCKLYITDTTCEAEVQTLLQRVPRPGRKLEYADKSTNTDFRSHNKSCGTVTQTFDRNSLLKRLITYEISSITSDREMLNIAGTTHGVFHMLLKTLNRKNFDEDDSKVPIEKSLLIFLMRMKTGLPFSAISAIVGVDRTTASRTFYVTLMFLAAACKKFVFWPSKEVVQGTMPEAFKQPYKDCRVIIDCFEIPVGEPSSDKLRIKFYSDCTDRFAIKVLVGYSPNGLVSFVSRCYPGATTESEIINGCGILDLLNDGDTVIADKAFSEIKESVEDNEREIKVVRLSFKKNPCAEDEIEDIDQIRRVAMDLKKIVRRMKTYKILDKLQVQMYPDSDSILFMCAVLVNCQIIRQL